ncbi:hypothetical protein [Actinopolymorpha pittospori]|uniref:Uncharacterized protein n=1 Tax=Actinopolymorpha pittospori TaxID=648752 RepID=A0A927MVZ3_9ACTN|nr:hypothetical protein [Actinopolymorpha pittospori]MBE1604300.1 hypothetical protein [Actinopolymorpha pittospori]
MKQRPDLENALESILVDAYGDAEHYTAFLTVIEDEAQLPVSAKLLGTPVTVTGFDYLDDARGVIATCKGPDGVGEVALADLAFPPETVIAWIHAAYRFHLGLRPFPVKPRPDWSWPN